MKIARDGQGDDRGDFIDDMGVVATARAMGRFQLLTFALEASGYADLLKRSGPFTLFAPADEVFSSLSVERLQTLLKQDNRFRLIAFLSSHIVSGLLSSADLMALTTVEAMSGRTLMVKLNAGSLMINHARIVAPDIAASNGIIHGIDTAIGVMG